LPALANIAADADLSRWLAGIAVEHAQLHLARGGEILDVGAPSAADVQYSFHPSSARLFNVEVEFSSIPLRLRSTSQYQVRVFRSDLAHLAATADKNKIHINLDKTPHLPWGRAIHVLAHEYGHSVENDLTSLRVHGQWFIEGFAEWVAAKVVDALGWQAYELSLRRIKLELARQREFIPSLYELSGNREWQSFIRKPKDGVMAYNLAAAAVDRLVRIKGIANAVQYIRSGDFDAAFGEPEAGFKIDIKNRVLDSPRQKPREFLMRKPDWQIGYRWIYEETVGGKKTALLAQIAKENTVRGRQVFVVKVGDGEELYDKNTLGLIATMKNKQLATYRDQPNRMFEWPLQVAKEWNNNYKLRDVDLKKTDVISRAMVATTLEEITVPAGRFTSAKIEAYNNESGHLVAEYWYAPAAKWFVKTINYGAENGFARLRELLPIQNRGTSACAIRNGN
jgi:hypothetical protein